MGLTCLIKEKRFSVWFMKNDPCMCCTKELNKDSEMLKLKEWTKRTSGQLELRSK
jgi:hypothetical protein